ncbi:MAG: L-threonine 3-dehydrogenase [Eubacteriales bacterium]|jgi:threonine 3-dehydrogenase|nr:L-threonine 3-dehydrogenase [Eubacteriales bacterium]MCI6028556.1 L-threonine 3-dehydrogenase [Clostridiales bacterium]MDD7415438.1 L-threonine 3-dehydrogenase [Clostridiales bacterium]MDY5731959.1 L-threonine 3-dehydrogenase [Eubacteriales bacterium]
MIPETMAAIIKPCAGKGLELVTRPVPHPGAGEVLIKIHKTAICGTDVHIYNWDPWSQKNIVPPMIIGHEYVGEIAQLGQGVTAYHVGQKVSGEGHIVCGHCRNCRAGNGQWCRLAKGVGVNRDGAFAEYLCIPATNVIPISDDIPEDIVSFFDAFGNATHTALMFDTVGEDVLITGAGPIGMMAAAIVRHCGARKIFITDVNEYRLDLAKRMGATHPVNVAKEKLEDVMAQAGIVEGFDVGLEMSGNGAALNQLIKSMRNGGKVALLGIAGPGTVIDWNDVIFKGLTLQGIYGRKMFETWYKMGAMIQAGLDLTPMVTHRFNYRDFEKGFAAMNSGESGKVVLDWTK